MSKLYTPHLKALPTPDTHDLPPYWDGCAVVWDGWEDLTDMRICPPQTPEPCVKCGTIADQIMNRGLVGTMPAVTHQMIRDFEAIPAAFRGRTQRKRPAYWRLTAFRCAHCHHDQVLDEDSETWWDLDPSDYRDDGSWPT